MVPLELGLLLILVGYSVIQLPLVLYLARYVDADEEALPPVGNYSFHSEMTETGPAGQCHRCGTVNDSRYTYCSQCLSRLAGDD